MRISKKEPDVNYNVNCWGEYLESCYAGVNRMLGYGEIALVPPYELLDEDD